MRICLRMEKMQEGVSSWTESNHDYENTEKPFVCC